MSAIDPRGKIRSWLNGTVIALIVPPLIVAAIYLYISGLVPEAQEELLYTVQDFLPIVMFSALAILLFSGYPVAFVLGGVALTFGFIGYFLHVRSGKSFFCENDFCCFQYFFFGIFFHFLNLPIWVIFTNVSGF